MPRLHPATRFAVNQPQAVAPRAIPKPKKPKWRSKNWWMRQLHTWHYMSAAISLAAMLMFAVTGFLLNHSAAIEAKPVVTDRDGQLPAPLIAQLANPAGKDSPLPAAVAKAAKQAVGLDPSGRAVEWSDSDAYVAMPRPGGDAWLSIDRATGMITSEVTDRGWISYLNDLHKGRNAGPGWGWVIDVFAASCIVFSLTGLMLLHFLARNRPLTWPLVGLGLLGPILIAILFIH